MIPGILYQYIYIILVAVLSFAVFGRYKQRVGNEFIDSSAPYATNAFLLLGFVILFVGLRPVDRAFVDMIGYNEYYLFHLNDQFYFNWDAENLIWDNFLLYLASEGIPINVFFLIVATLYFGLMMVVCRRLFLRDYYVAFLVFLAAFSTFSYGTNGIKAGLAGSMFCLAISYREKLKVCIPLILLTYGFHHSMLIPVVAFFATLVYNKPKYYLYFWLFSVLMAAGHVSFFQVLFAGFTDERGAEYLVGEDAFKGGFRLDFILYSAMPVWMGWYARTKMRVNSLMYITLLNVYTLANSVWMLCMYANFNNRIAYLSWFLYPIVLIYPVLNEDWNGNRYKFVAKIGLYHLYFTLFMVIVYYGIMHLGK